METLHTIKSIKGVGEKTEKLFVKLGIRSTDDLIHYYPRDYDTYEPPVRLCQLVPGKKCSVTGMLMQAPDVKKTGMRAVVTTRIKDGDAYLTLTWFNMPFLRNVLKRGAVFVFRGKVTEKNGRLTMEQPEYYTPAAYEQIQNVMQPLYGLTAGLSNKVIVKSVRQLLLRAEYRQEYLPAALRMRYHLAEYSYAVEQIHFPKNFEALKEARRRLVFDEFLLFILTVAGFKEKSETTPSSFALKEVWKTEEIMERLPYELTEAQKQVWFEIERDMKGRTAMARLVQGDVGSGKTIVAFLAMAMAAENGCQAAMMVPTEVLARQHYESLRQLLSEEEWEQYAPVLLTGSNTAKEKRERYELIRKGACRMIIGTHALIQERVEYHSLALVVTDEQHRFGVRQREVFSEKGGVPDVLVMSATPIPRTLAIILYGDLDISVIDELPARRLPIKNCVVNQGYRRTAFRFIQQQIQEGHQAYIICPMVEESEELDAENVTDYPRKLAGYLPAEASVAVLHGKMKPSEKNEVMERFAANEIQVLVSTTVVEVGVNVPNATVMMVENAERFGLAQLHQLRGRVGRGDAQSYCIFIQGNEDENTAKRLDILNRSNDGFYIAGEDLKLRGPGDILGIRQSGMMEFRIADIFQDADVLKTASEAAAILREDNGKLLDSQEYSGVRERLEAYLKYQTEGISL